jgi:o-succinylbenzoate---CoA ligase
MEHAELRALVLATGCAEERGGFVFLRDPKWSTAQRAQVEALKSKIENLKLRISSGWLCIPTGGTSGGIKFARHDERTLTAAARGFCEHFDFARVNAIGVLPAHHVSGLMARVRCAETGGEHLAWEWKKLEAGYRPKLPSLRGPWVISLVPTQLQRLLKSRSATAWLRGFKIIFLGGGPVWSELADAAARERLRVSLSYGMTETAAMVAALRPEEFLAGARSCGASMPHARVRVTKAGVVQIGSASVFRGYFPEASKVRTFTTEDLGRLDERGHLHILGRRDTVIITGGKKVQPAEVEAALRASGEFADVAVIGVPDPEWGEVVVACYPPGGRSPDLTRAVAALAGHLRPKRFVAIADWPRNAQGKVNRAALRAAALAGADPGRQGRRK